MPVLQLEFLYTRKFVALLHTTRKLLVSRMYNNIPFGIVRNDLFASGIICSGYRSEEYFIESNEIKFIGKEFKINLSEVCVQHKVGLHSKTGKAYGGPKFRK